MPVFERTYHAVLLDDPDGQWELHDGRLREKPGMSAEHNDGMFELGYQLRSQLDRASFRVRVNAGHVYRGTTTYFIPDVFVIPIEVEQTQRGVPGSLEFYGDPQPLVVEFWSKSTGLYDADAKLPEYQRRGDLEIWRLHPYDRTLTAWRRRDDGTYAETVHTGVVRPVALPNVAIDLDALFAG
ncbi:MAG: hypothetical protein AVDCRST_MAG73-663 [uncultured Thermomicrobiales bacterium]|uniref:Putative restriction endonuclease domain-containing protein n=1 Tax=uncultured Thermomicrobiales bacterium TaxID=1645740 RepID=A0A6J4TQF1_9BACT|nr:MAG: hypothetical protein AVDCRST_MAG73-663 [uncultured Thermomicrobiales bacterium]